MTEPLTTPAASTVSALRLCCFAVLALLLSCTPPSRSISGMSPVAGMPPAAPPMAVVADPPRDEANPASNRQVLVPSRGDGMNGLLLLASGEGPKPTLLLLHGLPGNERNLDLAQAVRRAGWNVLTFTYRGAWGSPGRFSIESAIEDVEAALAFLRAPETRRNFGIDVDRIVVAGHSMGGLAGALQTARDPDVAGLVLLDAWNAGSTAAAVRRGGSTARNAFEGGFDDLGHALVGATPASLVDEVLAHEDAWNLLPRAPELSRRPILTIYATHGLLADNRTLAEALRVQPGARVRAIELPTDHAFSDHRIRLASEVVQWLQALR